MKNLKKTLGIALTSAILAVGLAVGASAQTLSGGALCPGGGSGRSSVLGNLNAGCPSGTSSGNSLPGYVNSFLKQCGIDPSALCAAPTNGGKTNCASNSGNTANCNPNCGSAANCAPNSGNTANCNPNCKNAANCAPSCGNGTNCTPGCSGQDPQPAQRRQSDAALLRPERLRLRHRQSQDGQQEL